MHYFLQYWQLLLYCVLGLNLKVGEFRSNKYFKEDSRAKMEPMWILQPLNERSSRSYPSPVSAQHACICHLCFRIDCRLSCLEISAADMHPLTSCLLAKTRMLARFNSSWPIILWSSSLVMDRRSWSVESTTRMTNWKEQKVKTWKIIYPDRGGSKLSFLC